MSDRVSNWTLIVINRESLNLSCIHLVKVSRSLDSKTTHVTLSTYDVTLSLTLWHNSPSQICHLLVRCTYICWKYRTVSPFYHLNCSVGDPSLSYPYHRSNAETMSGEWGLVQTQYSQAFLYFGHLMQFGKAFPTVVGKKESQACACKLLYTTLLPQLGIAWC